MLRNKPMPEEFIRKFINEVKKRGCLWNPEHDRYNDRFHMITAWSELSDVMKLQGTRLRRKWKVLRDQFNKELQKYGLEDEYKGRWDFFEDMMFLHRPGFHRAATKEVENENDDSDDTKDEFNDADELNFEIEEEEQEPNGNNEAVYLHDTSEEEPIPDKRKLDCEIKEEKQEPNGDNEAVYLHENFEEDPIPNKRKKLPTKDDYDVMFLKSLAPYFKQLNPVRKLVVRNKMQDLLLHEIATLPSPTNSSRRKVSFS